MIRTLADIYKEPIKQQTSISTKQEDSAFLESLKTAEKNYDTDSIIDLYRQQHDSMAENLTQGLFESRLQKSVKSHEEFYEKQYPLYDKYKDVFIPKFNNYTTEKANNVCRALDEKFPHYQELREHATQGATQKEKDEFKNIQEDYLAYNSYLMQKNDLEVAPFGYSQQATKAYNYAVYEQLEKGVGLSEARQKADSVALSYDNGEAFTFSFSVLLGRPKSVDESSYKEIDEPNYNKQIDLRDYGYKYNFEYSNYDAIFGSDKDGIKKRIEYDLDLFGFLTKNEDVVDEKVSQLKKRAPLNKWIQDDKYAQNLKNSFNDKYEIAILAKTIFDKYSDKIFTNIQENKTTMSIDTKINNQKYNTTKTIQHSQSESILASVIQSK